MNLDEFNISNSKLFTLTWYVQIQTFDNQPPVFYLAIGQLSEDLKHLIPGAGTTEIQGQHISIIKNQDLYCSEERRGKQIDHICVTSLMNGP